MLLFSLLGQTVTPPPVTLTAAVTQLTDIGLFPIIAVAAVLTLATLLYKRFRK